MKIVVCAGGTGGHIYPALAIIDEFKKREKNLEVLYIGTTNRMESKIVPARGIPYEGIEIYGLTKNIKNNIKNIFLIGKAKKKVKKILENFKPDVVLGIGGYVTYPVLRVAKSMGIPIFIHEQNAIPGKTNRMTSSYADKIGVSFAESISYFPKSKTIYTGNPTGANALKERQITKNEIGLLNLPLVVIVAGSLGSLTMNAKMKDFLKKVSKKDYQVLYITGESHFQEFKDFKAPSNVKIIPYQDHLAGLLKSADVLVTRAGASTIAEIVALGIPSIFIPSPYVANNHQYYNALELVNQNAARMIEEKNLESSILMETIDELLYDKQVKDTIKKNLKENNTVESASIIYEAVKELTKHGK